MKILLITSKEEDYLQDSIIHGFKQLFGKEAIDYPTKHILYDDYKDVSGIRGNGFTLYGLLNSDLKQESETDIEKEISQDKFDLIVFTSIYRQYEIFYKYFEVLKKINTQVWIIDGEDTPLIFPYMPRYLKRYLFSPKPHNHFVYFKRELLAENLNRAFLKFFSVVSKKVSLSDKIKTISFSIPQSKIINFVPVKTRLFTQHIVDGEVAEKIKLSNTQYIFSSEKDYYLDIRESKFGITTKRAGWDCMRHYEIAANGSVLCFKNLNEKPPSSAPHGLVADKNCISYSGYDDLIQKIDCISEEKYSELLDNSLQWVKENTTVERVKSLLVNNYNNSNT